jgi:pyrroloquinoline quinone biosynthesis protein D
MASISLETIFRRSKDTRYTKVEEGGLVVKHDTAEIITLNPIAVEIFDKLDGEKSVEELMEEILKEYDVEKEKLREDLLEFLKELLEKNLIEIV